MKGKGERRIYKPSELTLALAVFRDLHELLERHGRSWYPTELRERAKRSLTVLADNIDRTQFVGPLNDVSNAKNESRRTQDSRSRAELDFVCQKLRLAVRSAIRSEEPPSQRLFACYLELHTLDFQRRLPTDLQQRFDAMNAALTRDADPTGKEWAAAVTIPKMNTEEVARWLDEIVSLLVEASGRP